MPDDQRFVDVELANVAEGPDPLRLSDVAGRDDVDAVVVLLQRDQHCPKCRQQSSRVADRYDAFQDRDAEVVVVLPDDREAAQGWQDRLDLPFPLLADPDAEAGAAYDQPMRFGVIGKLHDMIGRMPEALVIDATGDEPDVAWSSAGSTPGDRPSIDEILDAVDDVRSEAAAAEG